MAALEADDVWVNLETVDGLCDRGGLEVVVDTLLVGASQRAEKCLDHKRVVDEHAHLQACPSSQLDLLK